MVAQVEFFLLQIISKHLGLNLLKTYMVLKFHVNRGKILVGNGGNLINALLLSMQSKNMNKHVLK